MSKPASTDGHVSSASYGEAHRLATQLSILIVEDDVVLSSLLAQMLADMGHVVAATETTEAGAVTAALHNKPDLMIVDARLRKGNGLAAIATILRLLPIPYIVISGGPLPAGVIHAVKLQKPFMPRDLAAAIDRTMAPPR